MSPAGKPPITTQRHSLTATDAGKACDALAGVLPDASRLLPALALFGSGAY